MKKYLEYACFASIAAGLGLGFMESSILPRAPIKPEIIVKEEKLLNQLDEKITYLGTLGGIVSDGDLLSKIEKGKSIIAELDELRKNEEYVSQKPGYDKLAASNEQ